MRTGLRRRKLGSRMAPLCCAINASLLLLSPKIGDFRGPLREGSSPTSAHTKKSLEPKLKAFAVRTGLEPATSGVTGRYSNQLNYRTRVVRTSFSKASAKVLLFFELTKFFGRKMQKNMHFFDFCFVFEYYTMQIWRFLYFSMLQTLFSEKPLIGRKNSCFGNEQRQ